jgi:hypothetical protein
MDGMKPSPNEAQGKATLFEKAMIALCAVGGAIAILLLAHGVAPL